MRRLNWKFEWIDLKEKRCYIFFLKITLLLSLFNVIFCSSVIFLADFKMHIVSYNNVQNGLMFFFICLHMHMYVIDDVHQNETLVNYKLIRLNYMVTIYTRRKTLSIIFFCDEFLQNFPFPVALSY